MAQPRPPPGDDIPFIGLPNTSQPDSHHAPRLNAVPCLPALSQSLISRLKNANTPQSTMSTNVYQSSMVARMSSFPNTTSRNAQPMVPTTSQMVPTSSRGTIGQQRNLQTHPHASTTRPTQHQDLVNINLGLSYTSPTSPLTTVSALHRLPAGARRPNRRRYLSRFTVFPKLPLDLQHKIWSIAIAHQYHKDKRMLRVAPDSESLERTEDESHDAQLRIISDIYRRPRLVPALLHACQYSRRQAIQGYELWGCADPITYEENGAKVYVKTDIDCFFFGDADLSKFWGLQTLLNESELETANADDTARVNFLRQMGQIKHFTFDYELWIQMLEYEAVWLANLDSATKLSIAVRNPNHEELTKDYALCFMRSIVPHTFRDEAARIIHAMTIRSLVASTPDFRDLRWPATGALLLSVYSLAMGNSIGNTEADESYLEDVLIEGNRSGVVSDQYLKARLALMHQGPLPPAPLPALAPIPTPTL